MFDQNDFVGGRPCLDFVNTVGGIRSGPANDKLGTYADLLDWAHAGGFVTKAQFEALKREANEHPVQAEKILKRAILLREAMHDAFRGLIKGKVPKLDDLALINRELGEALAHACIKKGQKGFQWDWSDEISLDLPLWAPARSAGELIVDMDVSRLHECASDTCGWLFLDETRNGSRRWCDMKGCGNRAKVRRFRSQN